MGTRFAGFAKQINNKENANIKENIIAGIVVKYIGTGQPDDYNNARAESCLR